jgi:hypothetical protein
VDDQLAEIRARVEAATGPVVGDVEFLLGLVDSLQAQVTYLRPQVTGVSFRGIPK